MATAPWCDFRFRLVYSDASETRQDTVFESDGGKMNPERDAYAAGGAAHDPRQLPIVPMTQGYLSEDDKLLVYMYANAAKTYDASNDYLRIPVTIRNVKTGVVQERFLTEADLNMFSTDTLFVASVWTRAGYYTVSAQEQLKIGHRIAENSRAVFQLDTTD